MESTLRQFREDPAVWAVLESRALALAQHPLAAEADLGEELLTFQLGQDRYGIAANLVQEVQMLGKHTPLPGTPAFVLGLVNVRGRLLAVLDIRPLLHQPTLAPRSAAVLMIVQAHGMEVGLLADEVIEIRRASLEQSPALTTSNGQTIAWVRGIDRDLTILIDLNALLADPRLVVNDTSTLGLVDEATARIQL
jgi:purine-binding chemotaxis protein CheW